MIINLPITCNTLKRLLLYGVTLAFIVLVLQSFNTDITKPDSFFLIFGVVMTGIGTAFGWTCQIIIWFDDGLIKIKCKCDKK